VGVRAEHLVVHADGAAPALHLRAEVHRIEILSDQRLMHLTWAEGRHVAVSAAFSDAGLDPGAAVSVELRRALWFDAEGRRVAASQPA
jgi:hypothetical protein